MKVRKSTEVKIKLSKLPTERVVSATIISQDNKQIVDLSKKFHLSIEWEAD